MNDPVLQAAVNLKKELADVKSPEAHAAMDEIMRLLLEATEAATDAKLCPVCDGYGYYWKETERDGDCLEVTCETCGGDGLAADNPTKGK